MLDKCDTTIAKRKCWPTVESLAEIEAAALTGAPVGTVLEVIVEPTGPAWLPIAVFFIGRGHLVYRVSSAKASDLRKLFSHHRDLGGSDLVVLERWADPNVLVKVGANRLGALIAKESRGHQGAERAAEWIGAGSTGRPSPSDISLPRWLRSQSTEHALVNQEGT